MFFSHFPVERCRWCSGREAGDSVWRQAGQRGEGRRAGLCHGADDEGKLCEAAGPSAAGKYIEAPWMRWTGQQREKQVIYLLCELFSE